MNSLRRVLNLYSLLLTKKGHCKALHNTACSSQGEVPLGVVDHGQDPSSHSCSQVSHSHVHQSEVERLPQLLVQEGHDDHCSVEYDGRNGKNCHNDGEDEEASA